VNVPQNHDRVEAIGDQLRAKITSKFTASTFLAGFALTILSGQVFTIWQSTVLPFLFPLAVGIVTAAVVLLVDAVLRLDEITMPKRFWDESQDAGDTGHNSREGYLLDDDLWELRKHMIFYWTRLTLIGTWMTGIGALTMLVPFKPLPTESIRQVAFALAVLGLVVGIGYRTVALTFARNSKDPRKRLKRLIRQPD
jgi:hypothetical protein